MYDIEVVKFWGKKLHEQRHKRKKLTIYKTKQKIIRKRVKTL